MFWNWLKSIFNKPTVSSGGNVQDEKKDPPWYSAAKKYEGKKETDSKFAAIMVPLWKKLFNRNIGTIATSSAAWCGLGMAAALYWGGQSWQKGGEMARTWQNYGVAIDWRKDGIPKGAIVQINHSKCGSSSSNHVAQANGDCSPGDLLKSNATVDLYGANQRDTWKVSTYSVGEICAVRWPPNYPVAPKIVKSEKCSSGARDNESTR